MEKETQKTTVTLIAGGPMIIKGDAIITASDGKTIQLSEQQKSQGIAICRCGKTKNPPFCDGSHLK